MRKKRFSNWVHNIGEFTYAGAYILATIKHNVVSYGMKHRLFCNNFSPECIIQVIFSAYCWIIHMFTINMYTKLMKWKALRKHSLHEKTAASVFGLRPQTQPIYSFGFGVPIWQLFLWWFPISLYYNYALYWKCWEPPILTSGMLTYLCYLI